MIRILCYRQNEKRVFQLTFSFYILTPNAYSVSCCQCSFSQHPCSGTVCSCVGISRFCTAISVSENRSVLSGSLWPHGLYPMDYTVHGILQARILKWVAFPFSIFPTQGRSPTSQVDSLPTESPGKSKSTGVGSLSLLQGIFPTQELNWGLLHCRGILYQLSYQGSPSNL